jgi:DNA-binding transcriptional LysR family regulator
MPKSDRELDQMPVAIHHLVLATPKGHPLTRLKKLRLRDMSETAFVWFPRRQSPAYYDRLMHECFRGGLKAPNIVQEAVDQATILSLVTCRIGVAFVSDATRWRCPAGVVLLPVSDLNLPLPFALIWRKDNASPVLAKFVADVQLLPEVRALKTPQPRLMLINRRSSGKPVGTRRRNGCGQVETVVSRTICFAPALTTRK